MTPKHTDSEYYSDAQWESMWIAEHRGHKVDLGTGNHLVCSTCGALLNVTTRPLTEAFEAVCR